jgi:hypothetical protein
VDKGRPARQFPQVGGRVRLPVHDLKQVAFALLNGSEHHSVDVLQTPEQHFMTPVFEDLAFLTRHPQAEPSERGQREHDNQREDDDQLRLQRSQRSLPWGLAKSTSAAV